MSSPTPGPAHDGAQPVVDDNPDLELLIRRRFRRQRGRRLADERR